jgi:hypothetical protein
MGRLSHQIFLSWGEYPQTGMYGTIAHKLVTTFTSSSMCEAMLSSLPSSGASTCPLLIAPPPLVVPLFFSGAHASRPPRVFVMSPLVMPPPPICLHLCLSLHLHLSLCPSRVSKPAGYCVASHHANASHLPALLTLVSPLSLVAPLLCLLSTLAGCHVASPHDGAFCLPASLPPRNSLQALGLLLIVKPNWVYNTRLATMRRTS